jgi:hypothetical protein
VKGAIEFASFVPEEVLPEGCPPADAFRPDAMRVYRLVRTVPPTVEDFKSYRSLHPEYVAQDECIARACSVYDSIDAARRALQLPSLSGRLIVEILLQPDSGLVLQTGRKKMHFSWWRQAGYDAVVESNAV